MVANIFYCCITTDINKQQEELMASYSKYKRPIEVILHPGTSHVRVASEADKRYPFHKANFYRWAKEGRVRFFGAPASINCKEFERDLKNGLPVQYGRYEDSAA